MQNNSQRHGLSKEESRDLCRKILTFAKAEHTRVNIESGINGFTRVAINRVTTAGETNNAVVHITSVFGKRVATVNTNRLDNASLERAVRDSETLAKIDRSEEHTSELQSH